jgi:hypothetical protein
MYAHYPDTVVLSNQPEKEEFKVGLKLSISQTPLYVKL